MMRSLSLELGGAGARGRCQVESIAERIVAWVDRPAPEHFPPANRRAWRSPPLAPTQDAAAREPVTHIDPAGPRLVAWAEQLRQDGVTVLLAEHRVEGWRDDRSLGPLGRSRSSTSRRRRPRTTRDRCARPAGPDREHSTPKASTSVLAVARSCAASISTWHSAVAGARRNGSGKRPSSERWSASSARKPATSP
jgi:hypothetical protein